MTWVGPMQQNLQNANLRNTCVDNTMHTLNRRKRAFTFRSLFWTSLSACAVFGTHNTTTGRYHSVTANTTICLMKSAFVNRHVSKVQRPIKISWTAVRAEQTSRRIAADKIFFTVCCIFMGSKIILCVHTSVNFTTFCGT